MIRTTVFEGPRLFSSEDPVENSSVNHATIQAKVIVEGRPDVSYCIQLFPHPRILQVVTVLGYMEPWKDSKTKRTVSGIVKRFCTFDYF